MTANKHYTMFTEKQTEHKFNTDCYASRKKKLEVKGNGEFIFNTWSKSERAVNEMKKCVKQGTQKHFRAGNVLFFDSWPFVKIHLFLLRGRNSPWVRTSGSGSGVTGLLPHWEHAVEEDCERSAPALCNGT